MSADLSIFESERESVASRRTAVMEHIAWDIQQVLRELETHPGALVSPYRGDFHSNINNTEEEVVYCVGGAQQSAAVRRSLRRLDRALQRLEMIVAAPSKMIAHREEQQKDSNTRDFQENLDTEAPPCIGDENYENIRVAPRQEHRESEATSFAEDGVISADPACYRIYHNGECIRSHPTDEESSAAFYPPSRQEGMLPETLKSDLCFILTRLAIPFHPNQDHHGVGSSVVSILERASKIWRSHSDSPSAQLMPVEDVIILLWRLLECQHNGPQNHDALEQTVNWRVTSFWLRALNSHFICVEDQRIIDAEPIPHHSSDLVGRDSVHGENSSADFFGSHENGWQHDTDVHTTSNVLPGWVLVQLLPFFLETALETVQLTPWEPTTVGNGVTETLVQWRILTGYLIEHIIQLQQEDSLVMKQCDDLTTNDVVQWLHERSSIAIGESSDASPDSEQRLLSKMSLYASELTEYALDALDGAMVPFFGETFPSNKTPLDAQTHMHACENNSHNQEENTSVIGAAEAAIQDSLRHVTLATNVLVAMEPWCSPPASTVANEISGKSRIHQLCHGPLLLSLWKAMVESFKAKANVSTVLNRTTTSHSARDPTHVDLAARVCYHQLQLTNIVLSSPACSNRALLDSSSNASYESTLTLSFLRALSFPDQLIDATRLWDAMEHRIVDHPDRTGRNVDLKRVLQATVLTLRKEYSLNHESATSHHWQEGIRAVVERLLALLLMEDSMGNKHSQPEQVVTNRNGWDNFFVRQQGRMTTAG